MIGCLSFSTAARLAPHSILGVSADQSGFSLSQQKASHPSLSEFVERLGKRERRITGHYFPD
jgi:hypothetical protein